MRANFHVVCSAAVTSIRQPRTKRWVFFVGLFLNVFYVFSWLFDASTTVYGLNLGYSESNPLGWPNAFFQGLAVVILVSSFNLYLFLHKKCYMLFDQTGLKDDWKTTKKMRVLEIALWVGCCFFMLWFGFDRLIGGALHNLQLLWR